MSVGEKIFARNKQRSIAYKEVFGTDSGKIVLYDLMLNTNMIDSSFDPDPLQMARKEGERNVCLRILNIIKTDIKQLDKLIRESEDHGRNNFE